MIENQSIRAHQVKVRVERLWTEIHFMAKLRRESVLRSVLLLPFVDGESVSTQDYARALRRILLAQTRPIESSKDSQPTRGGAVLNLPGLLIHGKRYRL